MGSNGFLEQFMAGWQMGQGRNENARREQEMQLEQQRQAAMIQQRAEEFEMKREEFALRKKQLEAEEAEHKLTAQKEAYEMRTQAAAMPPVTGAQQGAPPLGAEEAGPPPEQVMTRDAQMFTDPSGGPDIPMPILSGAEQRARQEAEQQAKMRAAIGMKVGEAQAMQPFEEAKFNREAGLKRELSRERTKGLQSVLGAFGTAKTEGQQNKVEIAKYAVGKMPQWQKFLADNKDKFGFYAGRMTKIKQSGALRPLDISPSGNMAKFTSELGTVTSAMLNALSGAAISPQEFERLKQQIPQIEDEPEVLASKMATMDDYFKFRLKNFNAPYQGPGWESEQPPPASLAQPSANPAEKALGTWYGIEILSGGE